MWRTRLLPVAIHFAWLPFTLGSHRALCMAVGAGWQKERKLHSSTCPLSRSVSRYLSSSLHSFLNSGSFNILSGYLFFLFVLFCPLNQLLFFVIFFLLRNKSTCVFLIEVQLKHKATGKALYSKYTGGDLQISSMELTVASRPNVSDVGP